MKWNEPTNKCEICGVENDSVRIEISASTLIFGMSYGQVFYTRRCSKCERKLAKSIDRMIKCFG